MTQQQAFRIHQDDDGHRAGVEAVAIAQPTQGEVLVRVSASGVNYKDALAGTGKGKVIKRFPITGGIDAAGIVEQSEHPCWKPGDAVIATGFGMAFDHDGGYAETLCVPGDWLAPMPRGLDPRQAMILGTAGFTAALAVHRLLVNGQHPGLGPILVTGASGGVGSIAINILARLDFEVVAVSNKQALHDWLTQLGASRIIGRDELPGGDRPLEKAVWGGAVDNVGGAMLAQITRTLAPNGNIASIGLAGGTTLETTVMPFILRGIGLLGCNSVDVPFPLRADLWRRLATDWRPSDLEALVSDQVDLHGLPAVFERMLAGKTHGRILVMPA
ncbi:acryloyl-CoA reductase [Lamprobacter modestohalophilus]|uniref:acrylyl-CoA reductase family protein n=1 Tax=Lamprobacter modestohalophilus TaxID=1064514 RepID=UPI002ADEB13A|nr:acryloyl-CoA reductase [Lamprobacter modestohalophilus]MEA1050996.1 acryloyl-CoA reductase [Lamprobacter modestohalophilus]